MNEQLEPGADLDTAVARRLGLDPENHGEILPDSFGSFICQVCEKYSVFDNNEIIPLPCARPYSTSISTIWKIVIKLKILVKYRLEQSLDNDQWFLSTYYSSIPALTGKTAPHVLALAALDIADLRENEKPPSEEARIWT